jgi:hypothetical protein
VGRTASCDAAACDSDITTRGNARDQRGAASAGPASGQRGLDSIKEECRKTLTIAGTMIRWNHHPRT